MKNQLAHPSLAAVCLLGLSTAATADVMVEQKFNVDAAGALSLAAMQGKTVTWIAADKSRSDNDLEFKSRLMRTFAGGVGKGASIVRLDEERIINLDYKKKRYDEITFAEMRSQTEEAMRRMEQSSASAEGESATNLPVSEENCEWSEPVIESNESGERQQIAGLEAERRVITATQTCRDPETQKACDVIWTMEQWLAPEAPGGEEVVSFYKGYAEKLGFDQLAAQTGAPSLMRLFGQYRQGWEEIEQESGDWQGYPLKSAMYLSVGGAECTTTDGQPISNENVFGNAAAEGVGSAAGGAIGGALAKGLFKKFGKKKEPAPQAAAAPGSVQLFRVETETTRIEAESVPVDKFEVPAGFTRAN